MGDFFRTDTGSLVDDDQGLEQAFLEGRVGLQGGSTVNLVRDDGTIEEYRAEDAAQVLSSGGYRFERQVERQAREEAAAYDERNTEAALAGAARGLTFGASDYALSGLGITSRDTLEKLQRYNPYVSGAGEAAGILGGALLTGGAGGLSALRGGAAGGAAALGAAAETAVAGTRLVQAAEAGGTLARAGAAAARLGAQGAVEGALYGAAKQVNDDWLHDADITAERVAAGAGLGALTGGAFGAAFGTVGSLGKSGYTTGREYLGRLIRNERATAEATAAATMEGTGALRISNVDDMAARTNVAGDVTVDFELGLDPAKVAEAMGPLNASQVPTTSNGALKLLEEARAHAGDFRKTQQQAVKSIRDEFRAVSEVSDEVDNLAEIAAKKRYAAQFNTDVDASRAFKEQVAPIFDDIDARLGAVVDEQGEAALGFGGGLGAIKRVRADIKKKRDVIASMMKQGRVGDAYGELDSFKRNIGRAQNTKNPDAQGVLRDAYEQSRRFLEDGRWGELAELQKTINPAWSERIRRESSDFVRPFFRGKSGDAAMDPFETLRVTNDDAVGSFLNRVGSESGAEVEATEAEFRRYMRALVVDAKTRAKALGSAELAQRADDLASRVQRIEDAITATAKARGMADSWAGRQAALADMGTVGHFAQSALAGVKATARIAQRLTGSAEAAAARVTTAEGTIAQRASTGLAAKAVTAEEAVSDAASGLVAHAGRSSARVKATPTKAAAMLLGVKLVANDPRSYETMIGTIGALQDPDSPARSAMRGNLAPLEATNPRLAQALEMQVQRTADFLASKAGPSSAVIGDGGDVFDRFAPPKHSADKAARLMRYIEAAQNPKAALERLAKGKVQREDVETLQALYPRLYQRFAAKVMADVAAMKKRPSYESRVALSVATGIPVDKSMRPDHVRKLQQAAAPTDMERSELSPQSRGASGKSPNLASIYQTKNDRLSAGRMGS